MKLDFSINIGIILMVVTDELLFAQPGLSDSPSQVPIDGGAYANKN